MNITCPFCNAVVVVDASQSREIRPTCPRCGESVPMPAHGTETTNATESAAAVAPSSSNRREGNRRVGMFVICAMLILAAVVAVAVIKSRSKRGLTSLAEMETLGYLPADTNLIIALQIAKADETPEQREILDKMGFGPGSMLDIERIAGIQRDQIEDAVLGVRLDKGLPRIRLVVRTKSAYDEQAVRNKLGAKASKKLGEREYAIITPPGLPFFLREWAMWCPSTRTLVAVFPPEDLESVPEKPLTDVSRFGAPIAAMLKERPDRDDFFTLVGYSENWKDTALGMILNATPERNQLFQLRLIGIGVRKDSGKTQSRSRPARVTETPEIDPRSIAVDFVFTAGPDADIAAIANGVTDWIERNKLLARDVNRHENRYSATFAGNPDEWERALGTLKKYLVFGK